MLACAEAGHQPTVDQAAFLHSVRHTLHLSDDGQLLAFLELFGFWLGCGTLVYPLSGGSSAVRFVRGDASDVQFLDGLLPNAGLRKQDVQRSVTQLQRCDGQVQEVVTWDIVDSAWLAFFDDEFGVAYARSRHYDPPTAAIMQGTARRFASSPVTPPSLTRSLRSSSVSTGSSEASHLSQWSISSDEEENDSPIMEGDRPMGKEPLTDGLPTHSIKWLPSWVLGCLSREESRCVLNGLWRADGCWEAPFKRITTSGAVFRDQLMQLALHCGCSPRPRLLYAAGAERVQVLSAEQQALYEPVAARADSWAVEWAEPTSSAGQWACWIDMRRQQAITSVPYSREQHGRIWCVKVQHRDHLIVAQRAVRHGGVVTRQSRPVVVHNCEVGSTDLYTDLCKFLSQQGSSESRLSSLALEAMVAVLQSIAKRFCTDSGGGAAHSGVSGGGAPDASLTLTSIPASPAPGPMPSSSSPPPCGPSSAASAYDSDDDASSLIMNPEEESAILRSKAEKKKLHLAAERFNVEGRQAFKYLQTLSILPAPVTPDSLVRFFRTTPGLDRRKIGEFLGGHEPLQLSTLDAYVDSFRFDEVRGAKAGEVGMDDALRAFLDGFFLPGEAQQIARILEKFSLAFFQHCPGPLTTSDAAYVLAYAVIMLNTDAHNAQVQKKMTKDEFVRNLRGVNGGKDLPQPYLSSLFDSITSHEIRMTSGDALVGDADAAGSDGGFSHRKWKSVISKSSGLFQTSAPRIHGRDMFSLVWTSALSMSATYLDTRELHSHGSSADAPEHKLLHKVQQGFYAFGRICAVYTLNDCFNSLIITLAKSLTSFMLEALNDPSGFSPPAAFGRDRRAQMVAVTLFRLVSDYGEAHLLEGWTNVLHCILWLRQLDLLPPALLEMEDFRDAGGGPLPSLRRPPPPTPSPSNQPGNGYSSKLSYLVSFFLSEDDGPARSSTPASAGADAQWAAEGRDVIAGCRIDAVFAASKFFRPASLSCLLRSLLQVSSFATQPTSTLSLFSPTVLNEEAAVFALERFSEVIERNQTRLADPTLKLWSTLYDHFFSAITHAPVEPTYYIERLVVNVLRFSVRLLHTSDPSVTSHCIQLLSLLLALSPPTLHSLASRIVAGLSIFLQTQGEALKDRKSWEIIGRLLLTFRGERQGGVAASAFATFVLCIDNYTTLDTFPTFLSILYQWTSPPPTPRGRKAQRGGGAGGGGGAADITAQSTADQGAITPRLVLDSAMRLHSKIASPSVETGLLSLGEGSSAREKARVDLWLSSIQQLCISCKDPRPDVRRYAMDCLQTVLLAHDTVDMHNPLAWRICLEKLLLPMMEAVAQFPVDTPSRPPPRPSPPRNADDSAYPTRSTSSSSSSPLEEATPYDINLRASSLLFSTFLHHLDTLLLTPDFHIFWLKLLGAMQQRSHAMQGGGGGGAGNGAAGVTSSSSSPLHQHFMEGLKNTLLVMRAEGAFDEVKERSGVELYQLTMGVIDTLHPDWQAELRECMREGRAEEEDRGKSGQVAEVRGVPVTPQKVAERSASAAGEELSSPLSVSSFLSEQAQSSRERAPLQPTPARSPPPHVNTNGSHPHHPAPAPPPDPPARVPPPASVPWVPLPYPLPHPHPHAHPPHPVNGGNTTIATAAYRPMPPPNHLPTSTASPARLVIYQPPPRPSHPSINIMSPAPVMPRVSPTSATAPTTNGVHPAGATPVVIRFPVRSPPSHPPSNGSHPPGAVPSAFAFPTPPHGVHGNARPLPGYTPVPRVVVAGAVPRVMPVVRPQPPPLPPLPPPPLSEPHPSTAAPR